MFIFCLAYFFAPLPVFVIVVLRYFFVLQRFGVDEKKSIREP